MAEEYMLEAVISPDTKTAFILNNGYVPTTNIDNYQVVWANEITEEMRNGEMALVNYWRVVTVDRTIISIFSQNCIVERIPVESHIPMEE
jgi:hypothetical protein